jgi:hypothetical protein
MNLAMLTNTMLPEVNMGPPEGVCSSLEALANDLHWDLNSSLSSGVLADSVINDSGSVVDDLEIQLTQQLRKVNMMMDTMQSPVTRHEEAARASDGGVWVAEGQMSVQQTVIDDKHHDKVISGQRKANTPVCRVNDHPIKPVWQQPLADDNLPVSDVIYDQPAETAAGETLLAPIDQQTKSKKMGKLGRSVESSLVTMPLVVGGLNQYHPHLQSSLLNREGTDTPFVPQTLMACCVANHREHRSLSYKDLIKTLKMFGGPTPEMTWAVYKARFERLCEDNGMEKESWGSILFAKLHQDAATTVTQLPYDQWSDYGSLVRALDQEYTKEWVKEEAEATLVRHKQRPGETVAEYGKALMKLAQLAYPEVTDYEAREREVHKRLLRGLNVYIMFARYKDFMRGEPTSSCMQVLDHLSEHDPVEEQRRWPSGIIDKAKEAGRLCENTADVGELVVVHSAPGGEKRPASSTDGAVEAVSARKRHKNRGRRPGKGSRKSSGARVPGGSHREIARECAEDRFKGLFDRLEVKFYAMMTEWKNQRIHSESGGAHSIPAAPGVRHGGGARGGSSTGSPGSRGVGPWVTGDSGTGAQEPDAEGSVPWPGEYTAPIRQRNQRVTRQPFGSVKVDQDLTCNARQSRRGGPCEVRDWGTQTQDRLAQRSEDMPGPGVRDMDPATGPLGNISCRGAPCGLSGVTTGKLRMVTPEPDIRTDVSSVKGGESEALRLGVEGSRDLCMNPPFYRLRTVPLCLLLPGSWTSLGP